MSWASRRKLVYISCIIAFFLIVIGGPIVYKFATIAPTCHDGIQNQGETAVDEGGPCLTLDPSVLQPHAILWARSFLVRDGSYSAVAYIENPNQNAGVEQANYEFDLYDSGNVLVAQQTGTTFIMPGGVTPVFVSGVNTGHRLVAHTYFKLTDPTLDWIKTVPPPGTITVSNDQSADITTMPTVTGTAQNSSVKDIQSPITLVAVAYDTAGNAMAASETEINGLHSEGSQQLVFTWPQPFPSEVGSIDITPLRPPVPDPSAQQ